MLGSPYTVEEYQNVIQATAIISKDVAQHVVEMTRKWFFACKMGCTYDIALSYTYVIQY
jgi:hypothetical protein